MAQLDVLVTSHLRPVIGPETRRMGQSASEASASLDDSTWAALRLFGQPPISACKCPLSRHTSAHHPTLAWMPFLLEKHQQALSLFNALVHSVPLVDHPLLFHASPCLCPFRDYGMGDLATDDDGGRSAILEHHAWAGLEALSNHLRVLTSPPDGKDGLPYGSRALQDKHLHPPSSGCFRGSCPCWLDFSKIATLTTASLTRGRAYCIFGLWAMKILSHASRLLPVQCFKSDARALAESGGVICRRMQVIP